MRPGAQKTLAVVGKGITFDSGGISIKAAENMEYMSHDMSGAAAVVGFMQAAAVSTPGQRAGHLRRHREPSQRTAYKPGDVIRPATARPIEILIPDAEGRVILSDALSYAVEQDAGRHHRPGHPDRRLRRGARPPRQRRCSATTRDRRRDAPRRRGSGERVWRLPLWTEYDEQIQSTIADIKNTGGRAAGAITAAWFLAHFVESAPGSTSTSRAPPGRRVRGGSCPYLAKDTATGVGVRLLVHFVRLWAAELRHRRRFRDRPAGRAGAPHALTDRWPSAYDRR